MEEIKLTNGQKCIIYVTPDLFVDDEKGYDHVSEADWVIGTYDAHGDSFIVKPCGEFLFEINRRILNHINVLVLPEAAG